MLASSGGGLVCRPLALPGVTFTSCYIYAPRAEGWLAKASRELCDRVKSSDPLWLPRYAGFVYRSSLWDRYLAALFAPDAVLVPVPGSDCSGKAPWAALRLAVALSEVGFALIRTAGFVNQIKCLEDSCHGVVRWAGGDARREP